MALNERLYADPLAGTPEYAFVPHVTVAQNYQMMSIQTYSAH